MSEPSYSLSDVLAPSVRRRPRWLVPVIAGIAVALVGLVALATFLVTRSSGHTVRGTLELVDEDAGWMGGSACQGDGGYADIRPGAQITVTDSTGRTVALGHLGPGRVTSAAVCEFRFTIEGVPGGSDFYGFELNQRGVVRYPADQLDEELSFSLGRR